MNDLPSIDLVGEIRTLCSFPSRLPGSDGERRAQEHVAAVFRRLGLQPETETFRFQGNGYARLAAHAALHSAAGSVGMLAPSLGALLSGAVDVSLFGDLESRWFWLRRVLPTVSSCNVLARVPPTGERRHRLVVMAHADVAREGPALFFEPTRAQAAARFFHEKLGASPNPVQMVYWAGLGQTLMAAAAGAGLPTQLPLLALTELHAWIALQMGRAAFNPAVPGASDNASGVAVALGLAERLAREPLAHTEVWLVSTGCEEAMLGGAIDLVERHAGEFDRERTWFLAVDTVGSGSLRWCSAEGLARRVHFDPEMADLAAATAAEDGAPRAQPMTMAFCTDALAAAVRGYRALSLLAVDEYGYPANYHWRTDAPDAIDPAVPAQALDFTLRLARRLDTREN